MITLNGLASSIPKTVNYVMVVIAVRNLLLLQRDALDATCSLWF